MPGITAGLFSHQLPVKIGKVVSQCKCHLTVVHILIPDIKSVFYIADGIAQPNIYSEWQHERGMKRVPHFDLVSVIQMKCSGHLANERKWSSNLKCLSIL